MSTEIHPEIAPLRAAVQQARAWYHTVQQARVAGNASTAQYDTAFTRLMHANREHAAKRSELERRLGLDTI